MLFPEGNAACDILILEGNNVSSTQILRRIVQDAKADASNGTDPTGIDVMEESARVSDVQDRCRCSNQAEWIHCRMEASVPRRAFAGGCGQGNRGPSDVHQGVLQSGNGSMAHGTSSGGNAAAMGICTSLLISPQRKDLFDRRCGSGSGREKRICLRPPVVGRTHIPHNLECPLLRL